MYNLYKKTNKFFIPTTKCSLETYLGKLHFLINYQKYKNHIKEILYKYNFSTILYISNSLRLAVIQLSKLMIMIV